MTYRHSHRLTLLLIYTSPKPYVRGQKNDYNAAAIAEAVTRPDMRFVPIKTVGQQDIQALHRLRAGRIKERTALCNQ